MKRGEIWWVKYDPTVGSEVQKTRPSVIVSQNAANISAPIIQVVPLTSKTKRFYPGEAEVLFKGKLGKAMANQIRSVSKLRVKSKIGELDANDMRAVELAIKIQLGLS